MLTFFTHIFTSHTTSGNSLPNKAATRPAVTLIQQSVDFQIAEQIIYTSKTSADT